MALHVRHLHLKKTPSYLTHDLHLHLLPRHSSSFSPPPPPPPESSNPPDPENPNPSPFSSYFSDIKGSLKSSPPTPPRRIRPDPQPSTLPPPQQKPSSSNAEMQKYFTSFRFRNQNQNQNQSQSPNPTISPPSSSPTDISLQDLLKQSVISSHTGGGGGGGGVSFDSIRNSLGKFNPGQTNPGLARGNRPFSLRSLESIKKGDSNRMQQPVLPMEIFGKEVNEKARSVEGIEEEEGKGKSNELVKDYSFDDLGEKLRGLRPGDAGKGFSLSELNDRLVKLRVIEEKETKFEKGSEVIRELREGLIKLKTVGQAKKSNMENSSILMSFNTRAKPTFMLKPPQEHLLERYLHPDHMSSAEKMKLELIKVRNEFKMSESDCGSARVQVAQLSTKIKYLSTVLARKDKHSRKGLQEMVQKRKKLLKYLRGTDWDSYCLVLSKLGIRDIPEYKVPDYKKTKSQHKSKPKSKGKSQRKGKTKIKA